MMHIAAASLAAFCNSDIIIQQKQIKQDVLLYIQIHCSSVTMLTPSFTLMLKFQTF